MKYRIEELLFLEGKYWGGVPWEECPICKRYENRVSKVNSLFVCWHTLLAKIARRKDDDEVVDIETTDWWKEREKNALLQSDVRRVH